MIGYITDIDINRFWDRTNVQSLDSNKIYNKLIYAY